MLWHQAARKRGKWGDMRRRPGGWKEAVRDRCKHVTTCDDEAVCVYSYL